MFGWFSKKPQPQIDEDLDEEELNKRGFDPLTVENQIAAPEQLHYDFEDDTFQDMTQAEIVSFFLAFKQQMISEHLRPYNNTDIQRHQLAHMKGGLMCADQQIIALLRSVAKEVLKAIGNKILKGDFNLTRIPFPIKICIPKTSLQTAAEATMLFPLYINMASMNPYPRNRFMYFILAITGSYYWQVTFLKPLNPILGETLEGYYSDGSKIFVEQIMHHPPISYFYMEGMNRAYKYSGYYQIEASAGLNSLQIVNRGVKKIVFKDGQTIEATSPNELFQSTFLGTTRQITTGRILFSDRGNNLHCEIIFGKCPGKPLDYFEGYIYENGKQNGHIYGSYLSHINVDETRYWDIRYTRPYKLHYKHSLMSDHYVRQDILNLQSGQIEKAQTIKDKLEDDQRNDRKLRENYQKKAQKK